MILNIALCADNPARILQVRRDLAQFRLCPTEMGLFRTPLQLIHGMTKKQFQIVLILGHTEIEEADFIKTVRQLAPRAQLVLMTKQGETAFPIADIPNPVLLPASADGVAFHRILENTVLSLRARKYLFYFPYNGQPYSIYCSDILYFEKRHRKITIHSTQGIYQFYERFSNVTEQLSPAMFLQAHENFFLNILYIQKLGEHKVLMQNAAIVPVSRKYMPRLCSYYEDFLWRFPKPGF